MDTRDFHESEVCTEEIPICWGGVIYGMDRCYCEGSPLALAMDHRDRARERLALMKWRHDPDRNLIRFPLAHATS